MANNLPGYESSKRAGIKAGLAVVFMMLAFISVMQPRLAQAQCEVPGVTMATASAIVATNTASLTANYMAPVGILPVAWTVSITVVQSTLIAALKVFETTLFDRLRKFWEDYLQALKDQTAEYNGSLTDGTRQLNSMMDTSSMGSNQRTLQTAEVQAKKDFMPTNEGCRFDTTANYMATATRTRRAARTALGHDMGTIAMNTKGGDSALGPAQLQKTRWDRYSTIFCDPDGNGGKPGCTGAGGDIIAADVTPSKTFFAHETIPMDATGNFGSVPQGDAWRMASTELVYNITGYEASKPVAKTALESSVMQDRRAEQRAYATQMDAVSSLVTDIVADRTPGPAAPEVKAIREKAGVTDASDHPSYREIRQSIVEQLWDPNYYVDLQEVASTTSRKELYLSAYNLMVLNLIVEKTEKIANALAVQTGNLLDFGQGDKRSDQQQANPVR